MERIGLEVDDNVVRVWRSASVKLKQEIGSLMNKQIATITEQKEEKDVLQFLNQLPEEIAKKGPMQEMQDDILGDRAKFAFDYNTLV